MNNMVMIETILIKYPEGDLKASNTRNWSTFIQVFETLFLRKHKMNRSALKF